MSSLLYHRSGLQEFEQRHKAWSIDGLTIQQPPRNGDGGEKHGDKQQTPAQKYSGEKSILGIMVESNLVEGKQDLAGGKNLVYGQSVTDACVGWASTEELFAHAYSELGSR